MIKNHAPLCIGRCVRMMHISSVMRPSGYNCVNLICFILKQFMTWVTSVHEGLKLQQAAFIFHLKACQLFLTCVWIKLFVSFHSVWTLWFSSVGSCQAILALRNTVSGYLPWMCSTLSTTYQRTLLFFCYDQSWQTQSM